MTHSLQTILNCESTDAAVASLCCGWANGVEIDLLAMETRPNDMSPRHRELLVHHDHMTDALRTFYGSPVDLRVLRSELGDDLYRREIILTLQGCDTVVEYGIVRIDLEQIGKGVRRQIIDMTSPLGQILMKHDVLRRIEPKWFLSFAPTETLSNAFGAERARFANGRLAVIHCNDRPAIELLEVVADMDQTK